jgi:hypothetical protein
MRFSEGAYSSFRIFSSLSEYFQAFQGLSWSFQGSLGCAVKDDDGIFKRVADGGQEAAGKDKALTFSGMAKTPVVMTMS